MTSMRGRLLIGLLLAVATLAVVAGLLALGSPAAARERRFDQRRVDDLAEIERAINDYHYDNRALPPTLNDLNRAGQVIFRDPLTQQPYEYRALSEPGYELCAVFQQPSRTTIGARAHDKGRRCFKGSAGRR